MLKKIFLIALLFTSYFSLNSSITVYASTYSLPGLSKCSHDGQPPGPYASMVAETINDCFSIDSLVTLNDTAPINSTVSITVSRTFNYISSTFIDLCYDNYSYAPLIGCNSTTMITVAAFTTPPYACANPPNNLCDSSTNESIAAFGTPAFTIMDLGTSSGGVTTATPHVAGDAVLWLSTEIAGRQNASTCQEPDSEYGTIPTANPNCVVDPIWDYVPITFTSPASASVMLQISKP